MVTVKRSSALVLVLAVFVGILVAVPAPAPAACGYLTPVQCVPNKTRNIVDVLKTIRAKVSTVGAYSPPTLNLCGKYPDLCYSQPPPQSASSNDEGIGTCRMQWRALLTFNNNSYEGYVESGALLECEMNMRYIETNMAVQHNDREQRKNRHSECDWRTAYEAGTSCRTRQNGYELSTCSPTCQGFWEVQWSARLELFASEGRWYDWDPSYCTALSETVLTCGARGSVYV
jgi:hypothetical protein